VEGGADASAKEIVRNCEETVRICAFILTHGAHLPTQDSYVKGQQTVDSHVKSLVSMYYGLIWNGKAAATCTSVGARPPKDVVYHSLQVVRLLSDSVPL
jgi:hypothetical protein